MAYQLGTKRELFGGYIYGDIIYALIACGAVLLIMWWYTNSLIVTILAFLEILSSLGLGFFFYCSVLRMPHFPFMNVTTVFLDRRSAIGKGPRIQEQQPIRGCRMGSQRQIPLARGSVRVFNETSVSNSCLNQLLGPGDRNDGLPG